MATLTVIIEERAVKIILIIALMIFWVMTSDFVFACQFITMLIVANAIVGDIMVFFLKRSFKL